MKSNKKRVFLIGVLMTISQIFLTGFVIFWLIEQYKHEENSLRNELTSQLLSAENQVFDSIMLSQIIDLRLKDSLKLNLSSFSDSTKYLTNNQDSESELSISFEPENDSILDESIIDTVSVEPNIHSKSMIRSIQLVDDVSRNYLLDDNIELKIPKTYDTTLLSSIFLDKLNKKGIFFLDLKWIEKEINDSMKTKTPGIFINLEYANELTGVNVSNYTRHILGLMFPQFLFSLLLLSLSAFAFYFTFKSLKNQIMLNAIKNDFISNISHELKTPVSTVMVAIEALKTYDLKENPKVADDYLNMMKDEMNRLNRLISKVINHSRLENKAEVIRKEKTNFNILVKEVTDKVELQTIENNINIDFNFANDNVWINIDKIYIFGVIFNLLDNSIKYAGSNAKIKITLREDKQHVFLTVADNGPGIPEEYLPRLFDTFFRVPQNDEHNIKGYGLGLSYVKLVMTQHDGAISVENIPGGGCSFTLKFPKT